MKTILTKGRMLLVCLCLAAGEAFAVSPDPVTFSWAVERGDVEKYLSGLMRGSIQNSKAVSLAPG